MTAKIQQLPAEVINLITAGEVIDSPAAVVRELAENALDAGATRIVINIWPELWRIQVADNGTGMDLVNLERVALAHSTSKIHNSEDLSHITSLGFRGEALHSLVQLANLEICSRAAESSDAWRVVYSENLQAIEPQIQPVAIAPGTIVTVSDLFGNWPARRQALPTTAVQLKGIQLVIQNMALCHTRVSWQVKQDDKMWLQINPGENPRNIIPQILKDCRMSDLQYFADPKSPSPQALELVMGLPDRASRHRPDWVKVAVNRRVIKLPELEQTIISNFHRTLPKDRYPICFLHLQITPEQIDWNRHPAKAEIYLQNMGFWQEQVNLAINEALRLSPVNLSDYLPSEKVKTLLKAATTQNTYNSRNSGGENQDNPEQEKSEEMKTIRAIAQVHKMYILAEHDSGVWLIEQHIAHERVLYEQICEQWQIIPLEPAIVLSNLSTNQVEQLQKIGLEIEGFGEQLYAIRSAPELLAKREDCADALRELSLGGDLQTAQVATACRSAIKNGMVLNLTEMQELLDQWQKTRNPRTCPHGRPICLSLEETSLSRFFRRHWVVGKSHGI